MPNNDDQKFVPISLPDITKVDPKKLTNFSDSAPQWRKIGKGLNMQGKCKNKQCQAFNKKVWTVLGFGTFFMSQVQSSLKCPICQQQTKGQKIIGIYKCELTGRGRKYFKQSDDTDDDQENSQRSTQNQNQQQNQQTKRTQEDKQIQFPKIICNKSKAFLKMNGVNGPFVQWRWMTLEIKEIQ